MLGVKITGIGIALPERVVTNEEVSRDLRARGEAIRGESLRRRDLWTEAVSRLEGEARELAREQLARAQKVLSLYEANREQFETSDEWIEKRTGIQRRHLAAPGENTSDLAARAAEAALGSAALDRQGMEFLVLGTVSSDNWTSPPTASRVQHKLGIRTGGTGSPGQFVCFDLEAACSTFPAILATAYGLVASGVCRRGLVIGADVMSRVIDWDSRNTCIVFGDGAFAMILEQADPGCGHFLGPLGFSFGAEGAHAEKIVVPAGGSAEEITEEMLWNPFHKRHKVQMAGRAVYEDIVPKVANEAIPQAVARAGLTHSDVDFIVLHQANMRMNQAVEKRLRRQGYQAVVYHDIADYANTTSATQGLALFDACREGALKPGMLVLDCAFGGGYTWGTVFFRWPELRL